MLLETLLADDFSIRKRSSTVHTVKAFLCTFEHLELLHSVDGWNLVSSISCNLQGNSYSLSLRIAFISQLSNLVTDKVLSFIGRHLSLSILRNAGARATAMSDLILRISS